MSDLARRLARLQTIYATPATCATCRGWHHLAITFTGLRTGETPRTMPERCPDCGRQVPTLPLAFHVVPGRGDGGIVGE